MNEKKDYILIDEGKNQHIEWSNTLREENDKIQYHEIIYIKLILILFALNGRGDRI